MDQRTGIGRHAASIVGAAGLAVLALLATAPGALACVPEDEPLPVATIVRDANLVVDGTVKKADDGPAGPVLVVRVASVLKGESPGRTARFSDVGTCPFFPEVDSRVIVAADADGDVIAAWYVDRDGAAAAHYRTDPDLGTSAEIYDAFGVPDTATADPPATMPGSPGAQVSLLVAAGITAFAAVFALRRW